MILRLLRCGVTWVLLIEILGHLRLLQYAMHRAGFCGMRTEWWHFVILDWRKYLPEEARHSAQVCGTQWNGQL